MRAARAPLRVLIVDDARDVRETLHTFLATAYPDVEPDVAANASQAIEKLEREAQAGAGFDLVLTDNSMPGMKGVDLLRKIAGEMPATHRVLMSSSPGGEAVALREPAVELFLPKPFEIDELAKTLGLVKRPTS